MRRRIPISYTRSVIRPRVKPPAPKRMKTRDLNPTINLLGKKGKCPTKQVLEKKASVKYLVPGSSQFALPLAQQSLAHLARRMHELLALRSNLVARTPKSAAHRLRGKW